MTLSLGRKLYKGCLGKDWLVRLYDLLTGPGTVNAAASCLAVHDLWPGGSVSAVS